MAGMPLVLVKRVVGIYISRDFCEICLEALSQTFGLFRLGMLVCYPKMSTATEVGMPLVSVKRMGGI